MKTIICAIFLIHSIQAQLYGFKTIDSSTKGNDFMNSIFGLETFSNMKRMENMTEDRYRELMREYTTEYFQVIRMSHICKRHFKTFNFQVNKVTSPADMSLKIYKQVNKYFGKILQFLHSLSPANKSTKNKLEYK